MPQTVPYKLSRADSLKVVELARLIYDRRDRQVINRYGMDVFQQVKPTLDLHIDFLFIFYKVPGVYEYVLPFSQDDARCAAFENAVAHRVHLLCMGRPLPEAEVYDYA